MVYMGAKVAVVQRHREDFEGIRFSEMLLQRHNVVDHFQFPEHVLHEDYDIVFCGSVFDSDNFLTGADFARAWKQKSNAPVIQYGISPRQSPHIDGNIKKDWGSRGDLRKHYPLVDLLCSPHLKQVLSTGRLLDLEEIFPQVSIDRSSAPGVQIAVVQRHQGYRESIRQAEHTINHPNTLVYYDRPEMVVEEAAQGSFGLVVCGGVFDSSKYGFVDQFATALKDVRPNLWVVMCRGAMNNPGPIDGRVPRKYPDHAHLVGMITSPKLHALRQIGDVRRLPNHFASFELQK